MSGFILNKISYYIDSLKRFIHSDRPLMLILGQQAKSTCHLTEAFTNQLPDNYRVLTIDGTEQNEPQQLISQFVDKWQLSINTELTSHRQQLDSLLSQMHQQQMTGLLIINKADQLKISTLAAISHLSSVQEKPPITLHIILAGKANLEDMINSLMVATPPSLLLEPLNKKETLNYIKYRLNKLSKKSITPPESVIEEIHKNSGGFPSLINHLTQQWLHRIMLENSDYQANVVNPAKQTKWQQHAIKLTSIGCLFLIGIGYWVYQHKPQHHLPVSLIAVKPSQYYTIQLLASDSQASAQTFINNNHLSKLALIHTEKRDQKTLYIVTTGQFQTHEEAKLAISRLPPQIQQLKPWLRQIH